MEHNSARTGRLPTNSGSRLKLAVLATVPAAVAVAAVALAFTLGVGAPVKDGGPPGASPQSGSVAQLRAPVKDGSASASAPGTRSPEAASEPDVGGATPVPFAPTTDAQQILARAVQAAADPTAFGLNSY